MIPKILMSIMLLITFAMGLQAEALQNATVSKDTQVDWMELQSGEWARGEFKGMYSGDVKFDSEEFGLVKFSVDDVKQIITRGTSTINLNKKIKELSELHKISLDNSENEVTGKLLFKDGKFNMQLPDGSTQVIDADNIASIASGELKESNYWSANVYLGVDLLSGNTQQTTITAKANAERRTSLTRLRVDYLSINTEVDGNTTTADNNRLNGSFDMYQTNHLFWRLATLEYIRDPFKNIKAKYTYGIGVGYDILYTDTTDWSITVGPGYQQTTFQTVEVNASAVVSTPLVFLDTRFSQEITDDIDFLINYNAYFVNEESGQYVHHAEISLETEIISDLTMNISLFWDRVDAPSAFDDGTYPGQDDFKTMLAIGYSY